MTYGYFPGCSLKGTGSAYEESLLALFNLLGLTLVELEDWSCCGATSYMAIDEGSAVALSARNIALARSANHKDIVTPCSACYLALRKSQDYVVRYPHIGAGVERNLNGNGFIPALCGIKVRHPLEVLYTDVGLDTIREKTVRQWRGGKVACYYGCQIVRPYGEVDTPHNPMKMDELLAAAGIPSITYALKAKCCGGSLTGTIHDVGVRLNYILLKEAARKGAQAIVTVCPLCQYNLDAYQKEIKHSTGELFDMPVLYFTQVLGWALGADQKALGLKKSISGREEIRRWFPKRAEQVKEYV